MPLPCARAVVVVTACDGSTQQFSIQSRKKGECDQAQRERARRAQRLVRFARSHAQKPSGRRLCCAPRDGSNNCEIAEAVGASRQTVRTWRERFAKYRLRGLHDEPIKMATAGLKRSFQGRLEVKPANAAHRSTRGMARASGVSSSSSRTFKLSTHSHG